MQSKILLRTLLLSTSQLNQFKYETDKKLKRKIVRQTIALFFLYLCIMFMFVSMAAGYAVSDMSNHIPALSAISIIMLEFIFTLLKTNGYLFAFKDYDTLMSLPFTVKQVVTCKFLYMYVKNLLWMVLITIPMEIVYGYFVHPPAAVYIVWSILALLLPLIPMVLASAIGAFVTGISSGFRHKNILQIFFTTIFVLLCFSFRFIANAIFSGDNTEAAMAGVANFSNGFKTYYPPLAWFEEAVVSLSVKGIILFILSSVAVFEVAFTIISKNYKSINCKLMTGNAHKDYTVQNLKVMNVKQSICFKEFRHFVNSANYFVNLGLGAILIVILCIILLFVDMQKVISVVTQGAPVTPQMILPAIPMVVFFFTGMTSSCCCSPSLEGKQMWLIQSLPISKIEYYKGKMLFNLYLTVPFAVLGNLICGKACGADGLTLLLCIVCGIVQCLYNTLFGLVCGIKHIKLSWDNEMEVIKQGSAMVIYMLPNMFVTMAVCVGAVIMGLKLGNTVTLLATTALYCIPSLISHFFKDILLLAEAKS